MNMYTQVEDREILLISEQYYPGIYSTQPQQEQGPEQGGKKRRRRRKKSKDEASGNGGGSKRKLSPEQADFLELSFVNEHKLESERKEKLASELGLDPRQVAVWFQNRRARWRSKKLEEEYSRLKTEHEIAILNNCRFQTEVIRLKEELTQAEEEIQKLMERCDGNSSNSPISSLSLEGPQSFLDEFGMGELENIFNVPYNSYVQDMDWVNT